MWEDGLHGTQGFRSKRTAGRVRERFEDTFGHRPIGLGRNREVVLDIGHLRYGGCHLLSCYRSQFTSASLYNGSGRPCGARTDPGAAPVHGLCPGRRRLSHGRRRRQLHHRTPEGADAPPDNPHRGEPDERRNGTGCVQGRAGGGVRRGLLPQGRGPAVCPDCRGRPGRGSCGGLCRRAPAGSPPQGARQRRPHLGSFRHVCRFTKRIRSRRRRRRTGHEPPTTQRVMEGATP